MSITSLILGITGFILSFIPVVGIVSIIPIIISIILGIINLVKISKKTENKESRAPSIAGISLSSVGLIVMVAWCIVIYLAVSYFVNYEDSFTEMLEENTVIEENINEEIESYKDEIRENLE